MVNSNWIRWVKASFAKHFDTYKSSYGLLIEGQVKPDDWKNYYEMRLSVTNLRNSSHVWYADIEVNMLVSCEVSRSDLYLMERLIGTILTAFKPFTLFKFGNGPDDNSSVSIGCVKLIDIPGSDNVVKINNFGQWNKDVQQQEANIEGHFLAELAGD